MKNRTNLVLFGLAISQLAAGAPIVVSGVTTGGAADPTFNALVNQFRTNLGGALNPPGACSPSPCTTGRREVNWDAVPSGQSSPNNFNGNFFNGAAGVDPAGRQRGMSMTTPGTGFRVSDTDFSLEATFLNPGDEFDAFSPTKLFASLGSNITDVTFSQPGSPLLPATVSGFGVVFSDVDYTGSTSLEFFGFDGASLGLFVVPGVFPSANGDTSQGSFSFLGVSFNAGERVGRVRIVSGSGGIDGNFEGLGDAVVMDDFLFGEPQAIPEPLTSGLAGGGLFALWFARRRRSE